jgi:hypothetical protein
MASRAVWAADGLGYLAARCHSATSSAGGISAVDEEEDVVEDIDCWNGCIMRTCYLQLTGRQMLYIDPLQPIVVVYSALSSYSGFPDNSVLFLGPLTVRRFFVWQVSIPIDVQSTINVLVQNKLTVRQASVAALSLVENFIYGLGYSFSGPPKATKVPQGLPGGPPGRVPRRAS